MSYIIQTKEILWSGWC